MMYEENRVGRFRISFDLIRKDPEALKDLFAQVVIFKAEASFNVPCIEYIAYSNLFHPIATGIIPPEYDILAYREEDGVKVRFVVREHTELYRYFYLDQIQEGEPIHDSF